jgi:CHAT domain-containing protein
LRFQLSFFLVLFPLFVFAQDWQALTKRGMQEYKLGNYTGAEELFSRALKAVSDTTREYATSLANIGHCQQTVGNFPAAQQSFRTAFRLTGRIFPPLHIERVDAALNLANAFLPGGQYDSCEQYAQLAEQWVAESVQKRTAHYQEEIFSFFDASIKTQNTMATLAFQKGQWSKAAALMEQQKQFLQQVYPNDYRSLSTYQSTLNNLSTYYLEGSQYEKAKQSATEHLSIVAEQKNKISYLRALNNLGSMYRNLGQYDSAMLTYKQAAVLLDTGNYRNSDLHVAVLNNIGELSLSLENYTDAISFLQKSIRLQEKRPGLNPRMYQPTLRNLAITFHWMGDFKQAEQTYQKLITELTNEILHNYTYLSDAEKISFFRSNVSVLESFSSFAFQLSGELKLYKGLTYTSRSAINDLFDLLMATKGLILHPGLRLKNTILTGSNEQMKTTYQQWADKKYAYANEVRKENADLKNIHKLSNDIEVLEKWLRLNSQAFRKGFVIEKKSWKDVQLALKPNEAAVEVVRLENGLVYGVMILTPTTMNGPVAAIIKSKPSQFLEKQFYKNYSNAIQFDLTDSISYQTFWKPIQNIIDLYEGKKINRIYFSADGFYNKINLNTLYNPSTGKFLIDELDLVHVTNMQEVIPEKSKAVVSKKAFLFGRPQFSPSEKETNINFSDLPGTEKEVDQINLLLKEKGWQTQLYKYEIATEANAKELKAPGIVHFATHGFVVQDSARSDLTNLLLDAGIVLAGAGTESSSGEDGILTAYEMMNVDLDNTQLVVLSACETGLGEYYNGEGVYGLQRAIRSAGSKNMIMSLWKVDDDATQKLMTMFYKNWLSTKTSSGEAFRAAQQELKKIYPQPKYWGAFIFTGR